MRQISIVLATSVITATVAVAGVLTVNPDTTRPGVVVRTSAPVDVLQMMKDAREVVGVGGAHPRPSGIDVSGDGIACAGP